jgi:cysteinyl-tRNA synthetase
MLEDLLPEETFVLGVDEHTGLVIDLDTGAAEVVGRGTVVVRVRGDEWIVPTGTTTSLEEIAEHGRTTSSSTPAPVAAVLAAEATRPSAAVDAALSAHDVAQAIALIGELDRQARTEDDRELVRSLLARAAAAVSAPVDVTETVRPLVELLLTLRGQARDDKRWAESDAIRDGLAAAQVEVRDTPDGVSWEVRR